MPGHGGPRTRPAAANWQRDPTGLQPLPCKEGADICHPSARQIRPRRLLPRPRACPRDLHPHRSRKSRSRQFRSSFRANRILRSGSSRSPPHPPADSPLTFRHRGTRGHDGADRREARARNRGSRKGPGPRPAARRFRNPVRDKHTPTHGRDHPAGHPALPEVPARLQGGAAMRPRRFAAPDEGSRHEGTDAPVDLSLQARWVSQSQAREADPQSQLQSQLSLRAGPITAGYSPRAVLSFAPRQPAPDNSGTTTEERDRRAPTWRRSS